MHEAIKTARTNRSNGMKVRFLTCKKNYRLLSFSKGSDLRNRVWLTALTRVFSGPD